MDRFVEIRFEGSFDSFFIVNYRIWNASRQVIESDRATLPECVELVTKIKAWQSAYHAEVKQPRLEHPEVSFTNSSDINHSKSANELKLSLNNWLNSKEFQPAINKLISGLDRNQVILVGIDMPSPELKSIPWGAWDFFELFPKADFALLRPNFSQVNISSSRKSKLNILTILGDSRGIRTDEDATIIKGLPCIDRLEIMNKPSKDRVREVLGGTGNVDILLFAGHGTEDKGKGKICVNDTDTLSVEEIKFALGKKIKQGLQLAIFNSCNGLDLGEEIADLHIPQAIVMMEAVPDYIAQKFLKDFVKDFSQGISFVEALRQTRNKLADEDKEYPYASWLPVLYYNPSEPLMAWPKPNFVQKYPWHTGLAASCLISLVGLTGVSWLSEVSKQGIIIKNPDPVNISENSTYRKYFRQSLPIEWDLQDTFNPFNDDLFYLRLSNNHDVTIAFSIQDLKSNPLTSDEFSKKFIEDSKKSWSDFKIIKEEPFNKLNNQPGYRVSFSTNQKDKIYRKNAAFILNNNKAYILTYSAPEELFTKYEQGANEIIYSLKPAD